MVRLMIIFLSFIHICLSSQENLTANLGQDVTFSCIVPDEFELNLVSFMYQTTGAILSVGLDLFLDRSLGNNQLELKRFSPTRLDLKIFSVNQNDSGLYTCMIDHQILSSFFLQIFKNLLNIVPPRFLSYSPTEPTITYTEQLPMNLSCHVFAIPTANITWIYTNNNKQSKIIHNGENVYISSIKSVDSGLYECIASNGYHALISRSFYVTVQYSPRIINTKMNSYSKLHMELVCEICSIPISIIQWFRNGQLIVNNREFSMTIHSKFIENEECSVTTLTIHDSMYEREGRYECRAENFLGHKSEHIDTHSKTAIKSRSNQQHVSGSIQENLENQTSSIFRTTKFNLYFFFFFISKFIF